MHTMRDIVGREGRLSDDVILIGFFPADWNDTQIQELLAALGPLRKFFSPMDSAKVSMGFAVFAYADSKY